MTAPSTYSFGDNQAASHRLAVVDHVFSAVTDALLADVAASLTQAPSRLLDLGCGPGHTTARLAGRFPHAEVTGIDQSHAFLAEARHASAEPRCHFELGDVTVDVGGPAEVIYVRFLLAHLPDVPAAVAAWCQALAPGGVLVLEEPDHISSSDADFAAYLMLTATRVAASGADLYAGATLARTPDPTGTRRLIDRVVPLEPTAAQAAAMFVPNLEAAGFEKAEAVHLHARLSARRGDPTPGLFHWGHRQVVLRRDTEPSAR